MILSARTFRMLLDLGIDPDRLAELMHAINEDLAAFATSVSASDTVSKGAQRTRRWREKKIAEASQNVTEASPVVTDVTRHCDVTTVTERHKTSPGDASRVEDNLLTTEGPCLGSEDKSSSPDTLGRKASHRGSRLPADWQPSETDVAFGLSEGLTAEEIHRGADEFRDYWRSAAGGRNTKLDWVLTFRNRIRKLADQKRERGARLAARSAQPAGGRRGASSFADIYVQRHGQRPD